MIEKTGGICVSHQEYILMATKYILMKTKHFSFYLQILETFWSQGNTQIALVIKNRFNCSGFISAGFVVELSTMYPKI